MKYLIITLSFLFITSTANCQTYSKETVLIITSYGNMKIRLFNETPRHRDNFLKLVRQGTYDSLLFHRVINHFMIQGGDPDSKTASDTATLGNGVVGHSIPAEFNRKLYHRKGMLAAAREGDDVNPSKASSGSQFYIVAGKTYDEAALRKAEWRVNRNLIIKINNNTADSGKSVALKKYYERLTAEGKTDSLTYAKGQLKDPFSIKAYKRTPHFTYTKAQKKAYATVGGSAHLDTNYTVFGEVVEGLEVIDKIAAVETVKSDRPKMNVRMMMRVIGE